MSFRTYPDVIPNRAPSPVRNLLFCRRKDDGSGNAQRSVVPSKAPVLKGRDFSRAGFVSGHGFSRAVKRLGSKPRFSAAMRQSTNRKENTGRVWTGKGTTFSRAVIA